MVKKFSNTDAGKWDAFVGRAPDATFCHLSGWMRVVERVWGHQPHSIYAEKGNRVVGVLPLFHVANSPFGAPFGSRLVSTPNAVYGGVVADGEDVRNELIEAAKSLAGSLRVDYLELRDTREFDSTETGASTAPGRRQNLYAAFDHPITTDEDALMNSFPRDVRRMIRQGAKHGLSSRLGREELLDDFYDVYAASVRRLGTPVFPKRLFAEFLREFARASDILLIRQNGRVAGAVMSFYFRDSVAPYYGGAYPEFHGAGVNNFMYWELMRLAARRGCSRFDFGRSKRGSGSYEFKRGWGMAETALPYNFLLVRAGSMPDLNPMNPKFKLLIETWKRLPLSFTKLIGPMIVKYLP
ncbi:MAG: FemAB family XrtA/PEP-CTERM system-associated protein [Blastocatellia bacterium]